MIKEYNYVHPYKIGYGSLGPRWKYTSTLTFTWWFLVVSSVIMTTPLFRKQKIGFLGLLLLIMVLTRPLVQNKFPEEKALDFYQERKVALNRIVRQNRSIYNGSVTNKEIRDLKFEALIIHEGTSYFMVLGDDYPYGICYDEDGKLPVESFGRPMRYTKLDKNWYEFDY
ncbi:hypothetical protein D3C87_370660 [compost metagenome]